ncbi:MAG: hypothetical protein P4M11_06950 [Candidatus Pacebacteria bacterium]|nr:hypothetical protein [Candidatus Paceibacterota bacterium]
MVDEGSVQPYTVHQVEDEIRHIVDLLQDSDTTSAKYDKIEEFVKLIYSPKQFLMTAMQIDYLFEGNEDTDNIKEQKIGMCHFAGRGTAKRSYIYALKLIYRLLAESGTLSREITLLDSAEGPDDRTLLGPWRGSLREDEPWQALPRRHRWGETLPRQQVHER